MTERSPRPPALNSRDIEQEAVFLSMIAERPDDDDPRRVYADWLLDRGDLRGELIALQCDPEWQEQVDQPWSIDLQEQRRDRIRGVLDAIGATWLAPLVHQRVAIEVEQNGTCVLMPERRDRSPALRVERGFLIHPLCVTSDRYQRWGVALHRLSPLIYRMRSRHRRSWTYALLLRASAMSPRRRNGDVAVWVPHGVGFPAFNGIPPESDHPDDPDEPDERDEFGDVVGWAYLNADDILGMTSPPGVQCVVSAWPDSARDRNDIRDATTPDR